MGKGSGQFVKGWRAAMASALGSRALTGLFGARHWAGWGPAGVRFAANGGGASGTFALPNLGNWYCGLSSNTGHNNPPIRSGASQGGRRHDA
jgi:hypothetical protein